MSRPDPASETLATAQAIVDDIDLDLVRRHKERHPGSLVVGYLPIYAPRPLLEALGCLPVAVFGGGDQIDIIRGDSYFQSYICHIPRSVVELGVDGRLDGLDAMMFPSICDVIRNLGGMWKMLFPDKLSLYLDLPQNFDPAIGGRFYASELRRMAAELHQHGAARLEPEVLGAAIEVENERRAVLAELDTLRAAEPHRLLASEAYLVARAGTAMLAAEHTAMVRELIDRVKQREARAKDNVRVILRGAFCEQPPPALIRSLERAGCDIVDDDFQLGLRMIDGPIEVAAGQDPLDALAQAYLVHGQPTASRYVGDGSKGEALVAAVRELEADGVIFAAASFCDPALLDQPMLEAALGEANIPFTSFKFSENAGQFHVIREQAGAFSDSVRLWGHQA